MNIDRAHENDQGFLVTDGPFFTGGPSSPVGLDLPEGQIFYVQSVAGGFVLWDKVGPLTTDWRVKEFVAKALITEFFEQNAVATTTVSFPSYDTRLDFNTADLDSGRYLVQFGLEYTNQNNNREAYYRVRFNADTIAEENQVFSTGGAYAVRSGIYFTPVISGVQQFRIDFARGAQGTAAIQRATMGYIKIL
jgi:hypothetical protein